MAESILTSITMAGGALNIYYDTILESKAGNGVYTQTAPSGWKICIITSYSYDTYALVYPFAVFNASLTTNVYYSGICMSSNNSVYYNETIIRFNSTVNYNFAGNSGINWSIVFAA